LNFAKEAQTISRNGSKQTAPTNGNSNEDIIYPFHVSWHRFCLASHSVVSDLKDSDTLLRIEILPDSRFNLTDMEKVARRFLGGAAKMHKTARLSIYPDRTLAAQEAAACEGSFPQWKLFYDSFPRRVLLAANVISLRTQVCLNGKR
jgi:hypothetical protein